MKLNYKKGLALALSFNPDLNAVLLDYGFEIDETTDAETLDRCLNNYNWDEGFAIPYLIVNHPNCELATAVNAFWLAEGFVYFSEGFWRTSNGKGKEAHSQWEEFVVFLTENIIGGAYKKGKLPYPKRWAQELHLDIEKKKANKNYDKIAPVLYGLGSEWAD